MNEYFCDKCGESLLVCQTVAECFSCSIERLSQKFWFDFLQNRGWDLDYKGWSHPNVEGIYTFADAIEIMK